ncbi:hypothetical protein DP56_6145 [Burkholderia pseudomallei]|nr:hypothetical protein DP56_6145 [Burkholderia pseudomallei]
MRAVGTARAVENPAWPWRDIRYASRLASRRARAVRASGGHGLAGAHAGDHGRSGSCVACGPRRQHTASPMPDVAGRLGERGGFSPAGGRRSVNHAGHER